MVIACLDEGSNPSGSTYKATFWVAFFRFAYWIQKPMRQARPFAKKVYQTFS